MVKAVSEVPWIPECELGSMKVASWLFLAKGHCLCYKATVLLLPFSSIPCHSNINIIRLDEGHAGLEGMCNCLLHQHCLPIIPEWWNGAMLSKRRPSCNIKIGSKFTCTIGIIPTFLTVLLWELSTGNYLFCLHRGTIFKFLKDSVSNFGGLFLYSRSSQSLPAFPASQKSVASLAI